MTDGRLVGFGLVLAAVLALTVAQLVIKARLTAHGVVPISADLWPYLLRVAMDWRMWLGLLGLVVSSGLWYAAVSRLPLSVVYPFAALSYPLVLLGSFALLREAISLPLVAGNVLIVAGVVLVASSQQA